MFPLLIKNGLLQSASYLVNQHIIIDCGDLVKIQEQVDSNQIKVVILTHCHQDHIYGLCELLKQNPQIKVYCSQLTYQGLKDDKMNLSYIISEYPFNFEYDNNVVLIEEGKHTIDGLEIEVIATPGHSDDCLTYIIGKNVFTGDSYIPFAKVFAKWPRSNNQLAIESEQKLKQLIEERNLNVYCGHWQ